MFRVRTILSGPSVPGGGVSTFYFSSTGVASGAAAASAVNTFWTALIGVIGNGCTLTGDPEVLVIDPTDGSVNNSLAVSTWTATGSNVTGALPLAAQGLVRWRTGVYADGREIRGRTFIPCPNEGSSDGGKPLSAYISTVNAAATTLAADLGVWRRPRVFDEEKPHLPARPGQDEDCIGGTCWTEWAVLRSRRD